MSVANVAESRTWYQSFFGIEPAEDLPDFVSFKIGGTCGYWLVKELDVAVARAQELGGQIYRGPLQVPEIQRVIAQIRDPFGNVFGLEAPL